VVGAAGQVLVAGPFVLERDQLVDIGLAVDDALVLGVYVRSNTNDLDQLCFMQEEDLNELI